MLGVIVGSIFGLCFSTADKTWKRNTTSVIIFPVTFGILRTAQEYLGVESSAVITPSFWYMLAFFFSFAAVFVGICYLIKTQRAEKVKLRVLDIVLGYSKMLEMYYSSRQKEVENQLGLEELQRERKKNEFTLEKLQKKEREISALVNSNSLIVLNLPIGAFHPISDRFVNALPLYIKNYADFCSELSSITSKYIAEYTDKGKNTTVWAAYFVSLCNAINTILFDTHKSAVRSHVRILIKDYYVKLISVRGDCEITQDLTPIPCDKGMIHYAYKEHSSLVRSLNPNCHYEGKNDSTWNDYITFVVEGFEEDGFPLLSVGVSVSNSEKYQDFLYFINYLRIEETINNSIQRMSQSYDLNAYISDWRDKHGRH